MCGCRPAPTEAVHSATRTVEASPGARYIAPLVGRPTRFEHNRYLGDKRSQVVYDLDLADSDPKVARAIEELLASERFAAFGPDTLAEARNRGYRPHASARHAAD